ncbi:MAG: DEAD/DEAH box helicase family protein [Aquificaceae bacterium]|nr:DEAD/DEAH box helicase family protein [Aquificaceae bacterium]
MILSGIIKSLNLDCDNLLKTDLFTFSLSKTLFEYQVEAVKSAVKVLYLYYGEGREKLYHRYKRYSEGKSLCFRLKKQAVEILSSEGFHIEEDRICLQQIINRASFWMATGSGKTLVIIKVMEVLKELIGRKLIPKSDILFLTYREDLIEQFTRHLDEFNQHRDDKIHAFSLKDYAKVKARVDLHLNRDGVDVFYYRSDLLSEEEKEKILNYRRFPRNWYLLLDEAHKGDKRDSKRQAIFTALSKEGFMFNFSATFTEEIDHLTCAYNLNLAEFLSHGYGKRIALLGYGTEAIVDRRGKFSKEEKEKTLLKTLILFTLIKKARKRTPFYHEPLMLVLGNSVNTEESDLELFFKELSKIAGKRVSDKMFSSAQEELKEELSSMRYAFEREAYSLSVEDVSMEEVLYRVFNAEGPGGIEVIKMEENAQELIFKHKVSDRPFMLLKIGDISNWLKHKLEGYEIVEKFDTRKVFSELNSPEGSSINLLLGSRAFYEGWDSSRPNLILYLNIGKQEAKKFLLQSIGRGVRIEVLSKRKRLAFVDPQEYEKNRKYVDYLETLFILGTKPEDLKKVLEVLKEEDKRAKEQSYEVGLSVRDKTHALQREEPSSFQKVRISEEDFELLKAYCQYLGPKILLLKHNLSLGALRFILESIEEPERFYDFEGQSLRDIELIMKRVVEHFKVTSSLHP